MLLLELIEARLANVYIAEQIVIVVEKIFDPSANTQLDADLKTYITG
jgi:hypothetical protein